MLDQLVESKSHAAEDTKRSGMLLVTFIVLVSALFFMYISSLFGKDYGMGGDELSLETLVAPPVIEDQPEPEPEKQPEKQKAPDVDIRKELIATMNETPPKVPDKPSVEKFEGKVRDPTRFQKVGNVDYDAANNPGADYKGPVNPGSGSTTGSSGGGEEEVASTAPPPPPLPKKEPPKTISGGVLNGKATSLPKPPYPPAARAVRASGAVSVQVLISETGSVISANAVSGHPLLRPAAVAAARGARFSPTLLSGQPVKVSGVITYNFVP
jgi:protein TonB